MNATAILAVIVWYLLFTIAATVPFYIAVRLHLWREYYTKLNDHTPHPTYIDAADKLLAGVVAWLIALVWPMSVPAYVIRRAFVMRAKRRAAYRYADERIRWLRGTHEHR